MLEGRPTTPRATWITLLFLLAVALAGPEPCPAAGNPNILLLLADDIGVEQVSFYGIGDDTPPTPRLEALAANGLVFTDVWSNPNCSPSRVGILTGRYGFRTGVGIAMGVDTDPGVPLDSEIYLPELLRGAGYQTAAFGKWHLAAHSELPDDLFFRGFDHWDGTPFNLTQGVNDYYNFWAYRESAKQFIEGYSTTAIVDWTIEWIAAAEAVGDPWFAYVPFHAAHRPFQAPPPDLHTQGECTTERECFQAMIEALDTEMGRLLDSIDPVALADTVVIYVADNGTECGVTFAPFGLDNCKGMVRQGGVWVPMVIWGPGVPVGEVNAPVNLTDLFTTVLDLAGAAPPPGLVHDSVSLAPYFNDPDQPSLRQFAYTEIFTPNGFDVTRTFHRQVIRNERYALTYAFDGVRELYDLDTDPAGLVNLLADGVSPEEQAIGIALEQQRQTLDPGTPF